MSNLDICEMFHDTIVHVNEFGHCSELKKNHIITEYANKRYLQHFISRLQFVHGNLFIYRKTDCYLYYVI